ncbi:Nif3-like dinuclear metal center hexameric protein [Candidatus Sumerlaeota bacterium]|nr:Nif3-like dinuclear metal center hexameric protein [Candidatus Sumerlaeota bacterium]
MKRDRKKSNLAPKVSDVLRVVHQIAPPHLAESYDNVGLQIGDPAAPVSKVLVGLEVTKEFLKEADEAKADLLVTHHPLIFLPIKSLSEDKPGNQLITRVIRSGRSLIAAHTNLDSVANGTNGELADRVGLQTAGRRILRPGKPEAPYVKYCVFVPKSHVERVIEAVSAAGAGIFGDYSHCTFGAPGTGTFKPLEGAKPFSGEVGRLAHEEEIRLETRCTRSVLPRVMRAVRDVHPYEEIAYDVYTLEPTGEPNTGFGIVGNLPKPTTLGAFARTVKKALKIDSIGVVGDLKTRIERVALSTGASGSLLRDWRNGTADVFITGEMTHHDCADAHQRGLPVLLVGHWTSEVIVGGRFAQMIREGLREGGFSDVVVEAARKEKNPLSRI